MADFKIFFPTLMKWEGGFVDDKDDKGGATKWGITLLEWIQNGYDKNHDGTIDVQDLKIITQDDAMMIAKPYYWDRVRGDEIISQSIAELLCDWAYNSGVITASKKIQKIIGVVTDGAIGSKTLLKLNAGCQEIIFNELKESRTKFVKAIVQNNSTQKKFYKGWLNRINSFTYKG